MRYGTIPVAHATGGLRDTIDDVNPFAKDDEPNGTGWTFTPPDAPTMLGAVDAALDVYRERKDVWQRVMLAGMVKDLSWERSAEQYEQIFSWAFIDNPIRYH
ncbi:hypothetical protein WJX84_002246 [Apatococcus fuscideae]|uniref:Uncharacterized protein n=1 Tax=Apatococcus fuscideae TaxID=2026836 RepID=A0AAW1SZG2_9CHLO